MNTSIEAKREEFRRYLEESGVVSALTKSLIKLYEEEAKPKCAVYFVRQQMCDNCHTEDEYAALNFKYEEATKNISSLNKELASMRDNMKRSPSDVNLCLETGRLDLEQDDASHSLLKKYLTRDILNTLRELKTVTGATLLDCIQSGLEHHDSSVGIYAADADAYIVFSDLFDPIIEEYHVGFGHDAIQPELNWGDSAQLQDMDPDNKYVVSVRVRLARSVENYPFMPKMSEQQYRELEEQMRTVLQNMEGDYKGHYHRMADIDDETKNQLAGNHILFEQGDKFVQAARACRFWPQGRGVFYSTDKLFYAWVNEKDHLRVISMQPGGDLGKVYQRLIDGMQILGDNMKFVRHLRLGFLTFCPTNVGTALRASVQIRLPLLGSECSKLQEMAAKYNLESIACNTTAQEWLYELSNKRRIGLTEIETIKELHEGVIEIIKAEKAMEAEQ